MGWARSWAPPGLASGEARCRVAGQGMSPSSGRTCRSRRPPLRPQAGGSRPSGHWCRCLQCGGSSQGASCAPPGAQRPQAEGRAQHLQAALDGVCEPAAPPLCASSSSKKPDPGAVPREDDRGGPQVRVAWLSPGPCGRTFLVQPESRIACRLSTTQWPQPGARSAALEAGGDTPKANRSHTRHAQPR